MSNFSRFPLKSLKIISSKYLLPPPPTPCVYVFYYVGDGYDESDPFIDNSECFDETVPQVIKYTIPYRNKFEVNSEISDLCGS